MSIVGLEVVEVDESVILLERDIGVGGEHSLTVGVDVRKPVDIIRQLTAQSVEVGSDNAVLEGEVQQHSVLCPPGLVVAVGGAFGLGVLVGHVRLEFVTLHARGIAGVIVDLTPDGPADLVLADVLQGRGRRTAGPAAHQQRAILTKKKFGFCLDKLFLALA